VAAIVQARLAGADVVAGYAAGTSVSRRRRPPLCPRLMAEPMIDGESRQLLVGLSGLGRLLVVVFVDRGRIRIISTRRATPFERHEHEEARR